MVFFLVSQSSLPIVVMCTKTSATRRSHTFISLASLPLGHTGCESASGPGQPGSLAGVRGVLHEGIRSRRWPWNNERGGEGELSAGEGGGGTPDGAERSEARGGSPPRPESPPHTGLARTHGEGGTEVSLSAEDSTGRLLWKSCVIWTIGLQFVVSLVIGGQEINKESVSVSNRSQVLTCHFLQPNMEEFTHKNPKFLFKANNFTS